MSFPFAKSADINQTVFSYFLNDSDSSDSTRVLGGSTAEREDYLDVDFTEQDFQKVWQLLAAEKQNSVGNWSFMNGSTVTSDPDCFTVILDYLSLYFTPAIILVGLVGNTMSFLVFTFTHVQRLSSSVYLSSLAMADMGFLLALAVVWLQRVGITLYSSDGWCQGIQYIRHVCGFMSVWTVVSFTAERYVIVYHPLRKDSVCTKNKARIVICCLVLISLLYYTYIIVTYEAVRFPGLVAACFPLPTYFDVNTIMTCVDVVIGCVIPSVTIVVLNVRIIVKIHHYQKKKSRCATLTLTVMSHDRLRRRSAVFTSVSTSGSMRIKFSTSRPQQTTAQAQEVQELTSPERCSRLLRGRSHFRTARMLLVLSSVFVLLNLPSHVFRILRIVESFFGGTSTKIAKGKMKWTELFELFYFLNFAINFFIYSLCGQQFRSGLTRLCRRLRYRVNKLADMLRAKSAFMRKRQERSERLSISGYIIHVVKP